jgi:FkbM family methyltransferase
MRAGYCGKASRLRLAICEVGLAPFVTRVRVRLLPSNVDIWVRPGSSDPGIVTDLWGNRQYAIPARSHETIIDGGANIGLATVYFALTYPDAQIVAIEPEESNFKLLERNTRIYPNVRRLRAALWGSSREVVVVDPGLGESGYQVFAASDEVAAPRLGSSVRGVTVGDVLADVGWDRIGLLKLDIEGSEREVLRASAPWIDRVDMLIVELHDRHRDDCTSAYLDATSSFSHHSTQGELEIAWRD